jgi:cytochrome P450
MTTDGQPIVLDVEGKDIQGEGARLRERGPATLVELPGSVRVWAVGGYRGLRQILSDPRVSRNANEHWSAWKRGEIPEDWPLRIWATVQNMGNAHGREHRRLRDPVAAAFTAHRTAGLRPQIERLTAELLDTVVAQPDNEPVDLRKLLAHPLPVAVISELFGVPDQLRRRLRRTVDVSFDTAATPQQIHASIAEMFRLLNDLVAIKRDNPGEDLTTALFNASAQHNGTFTEAELVDTLSLMMVAGHDTTSNLLDQALTAMLTHPDQLELVRGGQRPWSDVIEETLRWQAPIPYLPLRYAIEDIELDGITIGQGEAILSAYASAGRDREQYGDTADAFDITRPAKQHLSFGHGVHHCVGAALARLEAEIALAAIFARFPDLALAVAPGELTPSRSFLSNGHTTLPVKRHSPARPLTRSSRG